LPLPLLLHSPLPPPFFCCFGILSKMNKGCRKLSKDSRKRSKGCWQRFSKEECVRGAGCSHVPQAKWRDFEYTAIILLLEGTRNRT
jgi:hypothetical protein